MDFACLRVTRKLGQKKSPVRGLRLCELVLPCFLYYFVSAQPKVNNAVEFLTNCCSVYVSFAEFDCEGAAACDHLFCLFRLMSQRYGNFSFTSKTFLSFFSSDSVAPEVRVRLVESDCVAHRVDSVVKLVYGFIQLLAVLILLPFVVAKFLNEVHTPRRDK